ncbi:hypothetical protein BGZ51_006870 [Haplosporangium sp. Z 767]|nr:hypothetical protein BGZ51_006870 [Haplosporangium sp. Z 767]KAF9194637.1 hypothetical protein BGZ50_006000 [Haplosporangium sp. Z 11]
MTNRTNAAALPFRNDSLTANTHNHTHRNGLNTQNQSHIHNTSRPQSTTGNLTAVVPGANTTPHPSLSAGGQSQPQQQHQSPPQQQQQEPSVVESTEQVLLASFKAAALSVTQLYKDSLKHQRAEHAKGYETALQDFLAFISNHPAVQEKKERGQTEDEIRQSTSLSVDDIVSFIANARSMNCSALGNEQQQQLHLHQQQQQQLHVQAQAQQAHEQQQLQQQQQLLQQQLQQQHEQQQQQLYQQQQAQHILQQQEPQHHQQQQAPQLNHGVQHTTTITDAAAPAPAPVFPSDAFTFTAPIFHPGLDQTALQGIFPGPEGGIGQQMAVDSLKRRYALQDFNMAANRVSTANATRISSPMNMDAFAFHDQPPFKRGRRREGE